MRAFLGLNLTVNTTSVYSTDGFLSNVPTTITAPFARPLLSENAAGDRSLAYRVFLLDLSAGEFPGVISNKFPAPSILVPTNSEDDLLAKLSITPNSAAIVTVSADSTPEELFGYLKRRDQLKGYPLIFIGSGVVHFKAQLALVFPRSAVFDPSVGAPKILGAIEFLLRTSGASPTKSSSTIEDSYFSILRELSSRVECIGRVDLFTNPQILESEMRTLLAGDPRLSQLAADVASTLQKTATRHVYRSIALVTHLLKVVGESQDRVTVGQNCVALMGIAFAKRSEEVTSVYTEATSTGRSDVIAQRISQSLNHPMGTDRTREILTEVCAIIRRVQTPSSHGYSRIASLIYLIDLSNRLTWRGGVWNPRGVHQSFSVAANLKNLMLYPESIGVCQRFWCEVAEERGAKWARSAFAGGSRISAPDAVNTQGKSKAIAVSRLLPGMRTQIEVTTYDGKAVVEKGTHLSADTILRLWRLNAIRAVNPVQIEQ